MASCIFSSRTLYAMFIADPGEVAHIMSDATPNSFNEKYRKVNKLIFGERGTLQVWQPGLTFAAFTAMGTIHSGAHASLSVMLMVVGLVKNPQHPAALTDGKYFDHISVYSSYLTRHASCSLRATTKLRSWLRQSSCTILKISRRQWRRRRPSD
jgi:hypothetical protein